MGLFPLGLGPRAYMGLGISVPYNFQAKHRIFKYINVHNIILKYYNLNIYDLQ